jgi:SAM-dependent methyltransferase
VYDEFSSDYDRFVNWPGRLAVEMPFIEAQLRAAGARRVLDAACGTGRHALALAQRGYHVVGADLSPKMIERAVANAQAQGVPAEFVAASFGELRARVGAGFDAVLCLGNSLPHLLTAADLAAALADFAACLCPGGLLLIQNRNFDRVLARSERWMEPQAHQEGEREWLFLRFYDFEPDGLLGFNVVTLQRQRGGDWTQHSAAARLWPQRQEELLAALEGAGFVQVSAFGDMQGAPFDAGSSGNLVLTARRASVPSMSGATRTQHQATVLFVK